MEYLAPPIGTACPVSLLILLMTRLPVVCVPSMMELAVSAAFTCIGIIAAISDAFIPVRASAITAAAHCMLFFLFFLPAALFLVICFIIVSSPFLLFSNNILTDLHDENIAFYRVMCQS